MKKDYEKATLIVVDILPKDVLMISNYSTEDDLIGFSNEWN